MNELEIIVSEIYKMFAEGKISDDIDACDVCCLQPDEILELKSVDVKDISLDLLTAYQHAAKPDVLKIEELKYFAPRYLEFLIYFNFPSTEPLLSLTRFGFFTEDDWKDSEWSILNDFAKLYFKRHLNLDLNSPSYLSTLEVLIMFYKGNFEIMSLLKEWETQTSDESNFCFNELLASIEKSDAGKLKINDPYSDESFNEILCNWIKTDLVRNKFIAYYKDGLQYSSNNWSAMEKEQLLKNYKLFVN